MIIVVLETIVIVILNSNSNSNSNSNRNTARLSPSPPQCGQRALRPNRSIQVLVSCVLLYYGRLLYSILYYIILYYIIFDQIILSYTILLYSSLGGGAPRIMCIIIMIITTIYVIAISGIYSCLNT